VLHNGVDTRIFYAPPPPPESPPSPDVPESALKTMAHVNNDWNVKGPDGLKALALKHGIKITHDNGKRKRKRKRKDDLMKTIKKHCKALQKTEGTNIHDSE
jgi:hypothetical protein